MVHLSKLQEANDPEMAALKSTSSATEFIAGELARGRDGYLNIGACRTKPGQSTCLAYVALPATHGPTLVCRSGGLSPDDVHVLLGQARVLDTPRHAGSPSCHSTRTHLHLPPRRRRNQGLRSVLGWSGVGTDCPGRGSSRDRRQGRSRCR